MASRECVLIDGKECNECGECLRCDLDPSKPCTNCCRCIEKNADFRGVEITEILWQQEGPDKSSLDIGSDHGGPARLPESMRHRVVRKKKTGNTDR